MIFFYKMLSLIWVSFLLKLDQCTIQDFKNIFTRYRIFLHMYGNYV